MKKIIRISGIGTLLLVMLVACSEDFLDKPAQGNLDANTLANAAGVEANLISAYSLLDGWAAYGNWGGNSSNWIWGSVASDDAYKGSEPGDQQPTADVELYQWGTGGAHDYLNSKWEVGYDGVNRANATISLLKSVVEADAAAITRNNLEFKRHLTGCCGIFAQKPRSVGRRHDNLHKK